MDSSSRYVETFSTIEETNVVRRGKCAVACRWCLIGFSENGPQIARWSTLDRVEGDLSTRYRLCHALRIPKPF